MNEKEMINPSATDLLAQWSKEQKKNKSSKKEKSSADSTPKAKKQEYNSKERGRAFCLVTYIDTDALHKFLKMASWVRNWSYCTHDRDVTEDGSPKEIHTHVLLYTYEAKTSSAVKKLFDRYSAEVYANSDTVPQNTTAQICHDMVSQYRYQLHLDDRDKFQYDANCRVVDSLAYWRELEQKANLTAFDNNTALAMLDDISSGVASREMAGRYGRDFIIHYEKYVNFARRIEFEEYANNENIDAMLFLLLQGCDIPQERIDAFYEVFEYLKKQSVMQYNASVVLRLAEFH